MYKWRHLIENFFGKLKEFKRFAMRADKTDQSFASMIHLGRCRDKLPMNPNRLYAASPPWPIWRLTICSAKWISNRLVR